MSEERKCKTCRYWDVHSLDMAKGDCKAPENHRYWRVQTSTLPKGMVALMDSFGPEETKPYYSCHAWAA